MKMTTIWVTPADSQRLEQLRLELQAATRQDQSKGSVVTYLLDTVAAQAAADLWQPFEEME